MCASMGALYTKPAKALQDSPSPKELARTRETGLFTVAARIKVQTLGALRMRGIAN